MMSNIATATQAIIDNLHIVINEAVRIVLHDHFTTNSHGVREDFRLPTVDGNQVHCRHAGFKAQERKHF